MGTIPSRRRKRPGFKLVELVIVVAIIAILFALLAVFVQKGRDSAARTKCTNNLKEIVLGVHNFEAMFKRMPPLYGGSDGMSVINSQKFPNVWGSTHVFIKPYIEQDSLPKPLGIRGMPPALDPNWDDLNTKVVSAYVCPADPSMSDGIVIGGKYGGTSYAANAQVFAPLMDETITGGAMYPATKPNFTDRGSPIAEIKDGTSNTIFFTHTYALCGSASTGTIWGYGAGVNQPPSPIDTFQPWSRASYLNQTYMTPANGMAFQVQPNPYLTKCVVTDPATPHLDAMLVALGDGSVRTLVPSIAPDTWNKACLPNDGNKMPADW